MKIMISLSYYLPNISGLTIYAKNLAEGLVSQGYQVTILASQHKNDLPRYEKKNGIEILRLPVSFFVGKGPIMLLFPFLALSEVKNTDIVNCHLPQFESSLLTMIAKIYHKKVVLTYHCDVSWEKGVKKNFIKLALLMSHFIAACFADVIVSSSRDYTNYSGFLKLFSKKVVYIYPPVITSKTNIARRKQLVAMLPPKKKYLIGFTGRISSEKGIDFLLNTIPILQDKLQEEFLILLVGPKNPIGEEQYWIAIEAILKEYKKHIVLLGSLSSEMLGSFYSLIDVLVLPSVNSLEAFGMVQIEAMLHGTPVITSDLPGLRVVIKKTNMGIIVPTKNSQLLADAIVKVLTDKQQYIVSRKVIEKEFSARKTIHMYEDLLK